MGSDVAAGTRSGLRRELGRFDTVCLLITAIVGIDLIGSMANGGGQSLVWLAVVGLLFFLPAALVISELAAAWPAEGGPYVWTRLAFGRLVGGVSSLCISLEVAVWVGGSLAIAGVTVVDEFLVPLTGVWRYAFGLAFVSAVIAVALLPLGRAKWITSAGAVIQLALLAFFTATVAVYAAEHGLGGLGRADLAPGWSGLIVIAPILVYGFIGFELPSRAAGELRDPKRDVPAAIARAGTLTVVLYGLPTLAILLVLPKEQITSLSGFVDALKSVFTVYGGHLEADGRPVLTGAGAVLGTAAAVAFVLILLARGVAWIMSSARSQAIACLDGLGPRFGVFSRRTGAPAAIVLGSGAVAAATSAAAFAVAGNDGDRYFSVVLTLSIALLALGNLPVFPAVVRLRKTHPHVDRPFRIPGGTAGVYLASALTSGWCLLAAVAVLVPGLGAADPDAALPAGFDRDRLTFTLSVLAPLVLLCTAALAVGLSGRRRRVRLPAAAVGLAE
jgi:amino acid transporter